MKKMNFTFSEKNGHAARYLKTLGLGCLSMLAITGLNARRPADAINRVNNLSVGGAVWLDADKDGKKFTRYDSIYLMDAGLIGVTVRLYADTNNDGLADGPVLATQLTNNYGQYNFTSLAPGNYVVGVQKPLGNYSFTSAASIIDPDDNVDQDNNGVIVTSGGESRSLAITLSAGQEPTYDGDGSNGNLTLDFAFDKVIGISSYLANCIRFSDGGTGYGIKASLSTTEYPPTYFRYAYQYKNAADNWICFAEGNNTINGTAVTVSGSKGAGISSAGITGTLIIKPLNASLGGLVTRCVLSLGQTANACSLPAGNTFNSDQSGVSITQVIDLTTAGCQSLLPVAGRSGARNNVAVAADASGIRVFPNPATGPVQLEFKGLKGSYVISLYNESGLQVSTERVVIGNDAQYFSLNRKTLSPGSYLLNVRSAETGKIVKAQQLLLQ